MFCVIYALRIGSEYLRFAFLRVRSLSVRIITSINGIAIEAIVEFYLLNSMWWNQNLERIRPTMCSLSYAYSIFWIARTCFNVFYVSVRVSSNFGAKFSIRRQCGGFTTHRTVKNGNFAKLAYVLAFLLHDFYEISRLFTSVEISVLFVLVTLVKLIFFELKAKV